jgi:hypothetical protein
MFVNPIELELVNFFCFSVPRSFERVFAHAYRGREVGKIIFSESERVVRSILVHPRCLIGCMLYVSCGRRIELWLSGSRLNPWYLPYLESRVYPGDHFEVTAWTPVTISNLQLELALNLFYVTTSRIRQWRLAAWIWVWVQHTAVCILSYSGRKGSWLLRRETEFNAATK